MSTAPKNEIIPLLRNCGLLFGKNEKPNIQHLQGFHACYHFPKNIINKYHHVVGHGNFFYKGHKKALCFILSGFRPSCPYSMVILCRTFLQIQCLCKGKDKSANNGCPASPVILMLTKIRPRIFRCKVLFFYVVANLVCPLYRKNFCALRQKT